MKNGSLRHVARGTWHVALSVTWMIWTDLTAECQNMSNTLVTTHHEHHWIIEHPLPMTSRDNIMNWTSTSTCQVQDILSRRHGMQQEHIERIPTQRRRKHRRIAAMPGDPPSGNSEVVDFRFFTFKSFKIYDFTALSGYMSIIIYIYMYIHQNITKHIPRCKHLFVGHSFSRYDPEPGGIRKRTTMDRPRAWSEVPDHGDQQWLFPSMGVPLDRWFISWKIPRNSDDDLGAHPLYGKPLWWPAMVTSNGDSYWRSKNLMIFDQKNGHPTIWLRCASILSRLRMRSEPWDLQISWVLG